MPGKRDLKLDEYGIDPLAYRELYNFCLQYPKKKRRLAELRQPYRSPIPTDRPCRGAGDSTANSAERAAALSADCEMIEQAASEAGGEDYKHILLAVTENVPLRYLQLLCGMKTGRNQFNRKRRLFFFLLAKKKKMIG